MKKKILICLIPIALFSCIDNSKEKQIELLKEQVVVLEQQVKELKSDSHKTDRIDMEDMNKMMENMNKGDYEEMFEMMRQKIKSMPDEKENHEQTYCLEKGELNEYEYNFTGEETLDEIKQDIEKLENEIFRNNVLKELDKLDLDLPKNNLSGKLHFIECKN